MSRNRFQPPMPASEAQLRSPDFLRLLTQAGTSDAYDREADDRDFNYWVNKEGQGLIDRGIEISHKGTGALGGLMYFWDRRIGWQATGVDAALYGPFAVDGNHPTPNPGPAAGWRTPLYDLGVTVPVPGTDPPQPPASGDLAQRLAAVEAKLEELRAQQATLTGEVSLLLGTAQQIAEQIDRGFHVPLLGDIKPIKP